MPTIPQILSINNLRATSAKTITLHTTRKLIKHSLKNVPVKAIFTLTIFEILMFDGAGSERVNNNKVMLKKFMCFWLKYSQNKSKHLEKTQFSSFLSFSKTLLSFQGPAEDDCLTIVLFYASTYIYNTMCL